MAHEEESQALARAWRNLQRSLSGERGLWADPTAWEALHWKLDKTEDPSHRSVHFDSVHSVQLVSSSRTPLEQQSDSLVSLLESHGQACLVDS